jgi:hypothetical protein
MRRSPSRCPRTVKTSLNLPLTTPTAILDHLLSCVRVSVRGLKRSQPRRDSGFASRILSCMQESQTFHAFQTLRTSPALEHLLSCVRVSARGLKRSPSRRHGTRGRRHQGGLVRRCSSTSVGVVSGRFSDVFTVRGHLLIRERHIVSVTFSPFEDNFVLGQRTEDAVPTGLGRSIHNQDQENSEQNEGKWERITISSSQS